MKVVIQRSNYAKVEIDKQVVGKIDYGFVLLIGVTATDTEAIVDKIANKIIHMRIFEDKDGKMNKSILDVGGSILSISQFTLYADCKKGNRPSFIKAARPEQAEVLYDKFNQILNENIECVETGVFGADMKVSLENDGPVTIVLDSEEL